jgi:hypothetical protein
LSKGPHINRALSRNLFRRRRTPVWSRRRRRVIQSLSRVILSLSRVILSLSKDDFIDDRNRRAGRNGLAFLDDQLANHARNRRRHFGVDLVGRNLDERFVLLNRIADLLEPLRDSPFSDRLAQLRHRNRRGHQNFAMSRIASTICSVDVMNSSSSVSA